VDRPERLVDTADWVAVRRERLVATRGGIATTPGVSRVAPLRSPVMPAEIAVSLPGIAVMRTRIAVSTTSGRVMLTTIAVSTT
jgi:hypothetical protein